MRINRRGVFISYVEALLVMVSVLLCAVSSKKVADGIQVKAEYMVSIEWDRMLDDDIDLWGIGPPNYDKPVFYKSAEGGALNLDRDSRGYLDDRIMVDGKPVYLPHHEVITIRGIVPGRYSFGVHEYQARETGVPRDPHHLGIVVHAEVTKINPKVTTIFRKDFVLQFVGDAVNIWSMDILPDGGFVPVDPPVEPIANRFYRIESTLNAAHPPTVP